MSRLDYCDVLPMTVQNIMLEHMQEQGLSHKGANDALIGIAQEMNRWDYCATDKVSAKEPRP